MSFAQTWSATYTLVITYVQSTLRTYVFITIICNASCITLHTFSFPQITTLFAQNLVQSKHIVVIIYFLY